MAVPDKTPSASSRLLDEGDHENWVDHEIASLRRSVESDFARHRGAERDAHATAAPSRLHLIGPLGREIPNEVPQRPKAFLRDLGKLPRLVRRHRFEIFFYGLCLALTLAAVLLAVSIGDG
jgi:hypothetical protein